LKLARMFSGIEEVAVLELHHHARASARSDRGKKPGIVKAGFAILAPEDRKARRRGAERLARRAQETRALVAVERGVDVIDFLQQVFIERPDATARRQSPPAAAFPAFATPARDRGPDTPVRMIAEREADLVAATPRRGFERIDQ